MPGHACTLSGVQTILPCAHPGHDDGKAHGQSTKHKLPSTDLTVKSETEQRPCMMQKLPQLVPMIEDSRHTVDES